MEKETPSQPSKQKSRTLTRLNLTLDKAVEHELKHGRKVDPNMGKKAVRRTISNRLSAQRSRLKKGQQVSDMEKMANELQDMISTLTPQIKSYNEEVAQLTAQNESLQKLVEIQMNNSNLAQIELEQKHAEVCRLRELVKTVNNNGDIDSSLDQQMQDLRMKQLEALPSCPPSLDFDQNDHQLLQNFDFDEHFLDQNGQQQPENFDFNEHFLDQPSSSGIQWAPNVGSEQPSEDQIEMLAPEKNEEEAEIDQYLNFEHINIDQANASE